VDFRQITNVSEEHSAIFGREDGLEDEGNMFLLIVGILPTTIQKTNIAALVCSCRHVVLITYKFTRINK
jgi:hypothetical protein